MPSGNKAPHLGVRKCGPDSAQLHLPVQQCSQGLMCPVMLCHLLPIPQQLLPSGSPFIRTALGGSKEWGLGMPNTHPQYIKGYRGGKGTEREKGQVRHSIRKKEIFMFLTLYIQQRPETNPSAFKKYYQV